MDAGAGKRLVAGAADTTAAFGGRPGARATATRAGPDMSIRHSGSDVRAARPGRPLDGHPAGGS